MAKQKKINAVFIQGELFAPEVYEKSNEQLREIYKKEFEAKKYVIPAEKILTPEEEEREIFGDCTIWEHKGKLQQDFIELTPAIQKMEQQEKERKALEEKQSKEKAEKELKEKIQQAREKIKDKLIYFSDPQNDNELLFNYQYEYFHGKEASWGELITLSFKVCKRLVRRYMKNKSLYVDETEQDEKAHIAMEYVLRRFQTNVGYHCSTNFITLLTDGVLHAMGYKTKEDENARIENIKEESRFRRITY